MTATNAMSGLPVQSLVEHLSTAIIVVDKSTTVEACNSAAEDLLELSSMKMRGLTLSELFSAPEEMRRLTTAVIDEGRACTERDLKLVTPALKQIIVDCSISPWREKSIAGERYIVELTSVERHQRIQSEETMVIQNQATAALMRGLAHEVKNPLGGIRGAAQLLERELEKEHQTEYTQIIIGEADRLHALVDRMLGPRGKLKREPINIHEVLERVRQLVEAEEPDALEIARDYDPSLPDLLANRDELIQAFLNLARNAMHAVNTGGGTVTLKTRAKRCLTIANKFHRLVLSTEIIDTGPGVDASIADSIFFPMVSGRADGSGLGLPLSQAIINRYGGLIGYTSEPGNTVFTVWLPLESIE